MINNDKKSFRAYWGSGYKNPHSKTVGIEFFTERRNYTKKDISDIKKLRIGQKWTDSDTMAVHIVKRIR